MSSSCSLIIWKAYSGENGKSHVFSLNHLGTHYWVSQVRPTSLYDSFVTASLAALQTHGLLIWRRLPSSWWMQAHPRVQGLTSGIQAGFQPPPPPPPSIWCGTQTARWMRQPWKQVFEYYLLCPNSDVLCVWFDHSLLKYLELGKRWLSGFCHWIHLAVVNYYLR